MRVVAILLGSIGAIGIGSACVGDDPTNGSPAPDGGAPDSPSPIDSSPPIDAGADVTPRACDLAKPFGTPELVPGLDTADQDDLDPFVTADGLTLYFARTTAGPATPADIYVVTRADRAVPFVIADAKLVTELSTEGSNTGATLTADGLFVYFTSDRPDGGFDYDLYGAARASADAAFQAPSRLPFSSARPETCPSVVPDKSALYVTLYDVDNTFRLYRASLPAEPLAVLDAPNIPGASSYCSAVTPDELTMVFSSDSNADPGAKGSWDIYVSTRAKKDDPWGSPAIQPALNTDGSDIARWVSADGCELWLQSQRDGRPTYDVYVARRPK